jgi:dihydrofolate reductase
MLSMIVAMSESARVIGLNGGMPWRLRQDLQRFKKFTTGHPIIMGRKTYQSIGKALPNRTNIVLSRDPAFEAPGCIVHTSLEGALDQRYPGDDEIFIIGGEAVYQNAMERADRLYVTFVDYTAEGDTFFPTNPWDAFVPLQPDPGLEVSGVDEQNSHPTRFMVMQRRGPNP